MPCVFHIIHTAGVQGGICVNAPQLAQIDANDSTSWCIQQVEINVCHGTVDVQ